MNTSVDHDEYGQANGHAPIAKNVICVDFDGTLFPFGPLFDEDAEPLQWAVEYVNKLKDEGFTIVIFTSRLSPTWLEDSGNHEWQQREYIKFKMNQWNIPFDSMTAEKIPAQCYIDDKAVAFRGDWRSAYHQTRGLLS